MLMGEARSDNASNIKDDGAVGRLRFSLRLPQNTHLIQRCAGIDHGAH